MSDLRVHVSAWFWSCSWYVLCVTDLCLSFFEGGLKCVKDPSCLFCITLCVCEWEVVFGDYDCVWILGSRVC